jgi:hypothetical protein
MQTILDFWDACWPWVSQTYIVGLVAGVIVTAAAMVIMGLFGAYANKLEMLALVLVLGLVASVVWPITGCYILAFGWSVAKGLWARAKARVVPT